MDWEPISRESLENLIAEEISDATPEGRALFDLLEVRADSRLD